MGGPVAMGSDWNGAAGHLGPRFGSDACGGWGAPNGFERPAQDVENNRAAVPVHAAGLRNVRPASHGLQDLRLQRGRPGAHRPRARHGGRPADIGLDEHYVDKLFCSAEAYIRVWERAEALGARRPAPDPNRPWLCNVTDDTPPASTVALAPPTPASGWHTARRRDDHRHRCRLRRRAHRLLGDLQRPPANGFPPVTPPRRE